jgi:integral membrane protein (TIGR01906 family)
MGLLRLLAPALIPLGLLGLLLWLLLTPAWVAIATRLPGFPADRFGGDAAMLRQQGVLVVDWLNRMVPDAALAEARLPAGIRAPSLRWHRQQPPDAVFNDRELHHMGEVRPLVDTARCTGLVGLVAAVVLLVRRRRDPQARARLLRAGMAWSWALLAGVGIAAATAFNPLFDLFHRLFFSIGPDGRPSWILGWSDTLIRAFPAYFWMVSGGVLIGGTLAGATIAGLWQRDPAAPRRHCGWLALALLAAAVPAGLVVLPGCRAIASLGWSRVPVTVVWEGDRVAGVQFVFQSDSYRAAAVHAVPPLWPRPAADAAAIRADARVSVNDIAPGDAVLIRGFAPWDLWLRLALGLPGAAAAAWLWRRSRSQ